MKIIRCPFCRKIVLNLNKHIKMDIPYVECPYCEGAFPYKKRKEYIMFTFKDFFEYFLIDVIAGLSFCLLAFFVIILVKDYMKDMYFWLLEGVVFIIMAISNIMFFINKYDSDKKLSLERCKDKEYLKLLYDDKLISEEVYNEYKKIK